MTARISTRPSCHDALDHLAFVINGLPEIAFRTVDLHKDLVEVPAPMQEISLHLHPAATDLGGEERAEPVPPYRAVSSVALMPRPVETILYCPR